jgi:hypothetical protein
MTGIVPDSEHTLNDTAATICEEAYDCFSSRPLSMNNMGSANGREENSIFTELHGEEDIPLVDHLKMPSASDARKAPRHVSRPSDIVFHRTVASRNLPLKTNHNQETYFRLSNSVTTGLNTSPEPPHPLEKHPGNCQLFE